MGCIPWMQTYAQEMQPRTVSGTILDEEGDPIVGANIIIKGTTTGTISDVDGQFSLNVTDPSAVLVISSVGYSTMEIPVGNQTDISVTMELDLIGLDEVVVVGYGVVKKSDLTGSVSSLNEDDMNVGVTTSVDNLLQGKSAGVYITQASAEPGGGSTIQIRGAGSINASSSPLYVIDGLPVDINQVIEGTGANITVTRTPRNPLNNINPSDIESIEILKDASATAIYGARGANGVIMITTKKGSAGRLQVNYNGYFGVQSPVGKTEVLKAEDYQRILNEILDDPASNVAESERVTEIVNGGTDWQDELFRSAQVHGGNGTTTYFASLNYFNQEGIVISSDFQRYDTRLNLDHVWKNLHTGFNFSTSYSHDNFLSHGYGLNEEGGALYAAIAFDPTLPVYDADGNYTISNLINVDNPVALANEETSKANNYRTLGTIFGEYTILKGWTVKLNLGFDARNSRRDSYVNTKTKDGRANGGIASILTGTRNNYLGELTTTYVKDFNENNSLTALAGFTYQKFNYSNFSGNGRDFPNDESMTNSMQSANPELYTMSSYRENNKLISYIGRLNYTLYNKYLFTATLRADGSSRFGENNKFGYFPSAAFAWKMHQEDFIRNLNVFSMLKFRASIGRTGNQEIGNYRSLTTFSNGANVALGGQGWVTLEPARIPNPDLKWETTQQVNIGLDMGFLGNRIYASLDYYQKNTYDMLFNLPVPSSTGFTSILQNIGSIKNNGLELFLETRNTVKTLKWTTSINLTTLKNRVTDLGEIDEVIHTNAGWTRDIAIIREGEALNSFYGYNVLGVWQNQGEIDASGTTDPVKPGDVKYEDINSDGAVNASDMVILGNSFPKFTFGITNTFNYKGIGLVVFLDAIQGIDMLNNAMVETYFPISHRRNRVAEPYLNRWTVDNPSSEYPSFVDPTGQGSKGVSSFTIEDASFVRLKTVQLNYQIPIRNNRIIKGLNIYVSGENLLLITGYSGVDPTTNSNGDPTLKIDYNSYPVARSVLFGVNLTL
ncbi:MAG: SusC/RagA family TonB-linked outer membrane protein [Bacteroides sp. SM23_62]|nr:MAG: SusC/RagA family TonB-linked outer membrane protein [Bacteroides sp. SM23_62]